jgi:Flp pilus assembly protein TadG
MGDNRNNRKGTLGAATAELAVLLPVLVMTCLGLVDFGRAGYEAVNLDSAANAGASYAMRTPNTALDTTGIRNAALADIGGDVDTSKVTVTSTRTCECSNGSSVSCDTTCEGQTPLMFVRVRVSKAFKTLFSYPGVPSQIALGREAQLRVR